MALAFDGDLAFEVQGPAGATAGRVSGHGSTLRVAADDPVVAWDAALGSVSTGPALLRAVAGHLYDEGVVVQVTGPGGLVATVGAGVDSPLGRVATGSRHVRLGRAAAVRPLAVAQARRTARGLARPAAVLAAVAAALWAVRRRVRR